MNTLAVICDLAEFYVSRDGLKLWNHVPWFLSGVLPLPRPTVTRWRLKPALFVLQERAWAVGRIEDAIHERAFIQAPHSAQPRYPTLTVP